VLIKRFNWIISQDRHYASDKHSRSFAQKCALKFTVRIFCTHDYKINKYCMFRRAVNGSAGRSEGRVGSKILEFILCLF